MVDSSAVPVQAERTAGEEKREDKIILCKPDEKFFQLVVDKSGQKIQACYQCHKCAAGCPVANETDFTTDKLIRLIQIGDKEKVLSAKQLQTCVACYTCSARCPNNINGARLVDALKQIAKEQSVPPAKPNVLVFHETFLNSAKRFGRVNEAELMGFYTMKAGFDWYTILKSPVMLLKGRLHIWGGKIKNLKAFRKLFGKKS